VRFAGVTRVLFFLCLAASLSASLVLGQATTSKERDIRQGQLSSQRPKEVAEPILDTATIWERRRTVLDGVWKGSVTRENSALAVEIHVFPQGASGADACLRFDVATKNLKTQFHICDRYREEVAGQTVFDPSRKPHNLYASPRAGGVVANLPGLAEREASVKAVLKDDTLEIDITAKGSRSPDFKVLLRKAKE
jgi:hypothetical protein